MEQEQSLFNWFMDTAIDLPGHKYAYTSVYMAMLRIARKQGNRKLIDAAEDIKRIAAVGRTLYFEAVDWLHENDFVTYSPSANGKLPSTIRLNLESEVRSSSGPAAVQQQIPSGPVADSRPRAYTPAHGRAEKEVISNLESSRSRIQIEQEENDDDSFQDVQQQLDVILASKIPPIVKESDTQSSIPVTEFCKVAGVPVSETSVREYIHNTHNGSRLEVWKMQHKGLDFDAVLDAFIYNCYQQSFDTKSYVIRRFQMLSDDVMAGTKKLLTAQPPKPPTPSSHISPEEYARNLGPLLLT